MTEASDNPYGKEDPRLIALTEKLKAHPAESSAPIEHIDSSDVSIKGNQVLAELIGAPLGGGIIGWLLDRWFNTSPWLLLIFLFLGFAVAMRNIYRLAQPSSDK